MNTLTLNLSSKSRYAIRLLLDLGLHKEFGLIRLRDIAERQRLPLSYLENLMAPLQAGGMIKTAYGPRGGVCLAVHPREIRLCDIVELMEGPIIPLKPAIRPEARTDDDICATCAIYDVWNEVKQAARLILASKTLADLVKLQRQKTACCQNNLKRFKQPPAMESGNPERQARESGKKLSGSHRQHV
jgi:Rrf2 family iron-sulfur cluster assembly transcriptional regulator